MARARARSVIDDAPPVAASSEEVSRCLVFCRVRPSFTRDYEDGGYQLLTLQGKKVAVKDERTYEFDGTFQADSKQEDVFRTVAWPCIQHAFKGFCSALMCYGQTGTGKSFTMCCTKPGQEGIIPQAAITIFQTIQRDPQRSYTVAAEFIQIYRDQLGDLMTEGGKDRVDIHFDAETGVTLPGCSTHQLRSPEEFMAFYNEGDKRRVVTATAMNPESSRGHTALVVRITSMPVNDDCGSKISGKITFIDLAGYERFSKTGISNANPIQKDEAKTINASLLALGHVVSSLSNGDKHIPWRNAKLTRLLQDSIGGRSRTTVILTVGPSSEHLHESTNTLQFGMRAMAVKVQARVTLTVDFEKLAARLQGMLDEKNARISDLEIQAAANDAERQELMERHRRDTDALHVQHATELEAAKARGATADQLLEISKQLNVEAATLKEQQEEEISYREDQHQKDMMEVFAEEQKKAQRDLVREKLARERAIAELEKRLDEARGGGNADLENALKELADRDSTLVQRATQLAAVHDRCARLLNIIKELGGDIPSDFDGADDAEDDGADMFVDVTQVEDMKHRFTVQQDALMNQVADLRAALENSARNAVLAVSAPSVVASAGDAVETLPEVLESTLRTVADPSFSDLVGATGVAPRNTISEVELEATKAALKSDIDYWKAQAAAAQQALEEEHRKTVAAQAAAKQQKPRHDDSSIHVKVIKELTMKVERLATENAVLQSQASTAEGARSSASDPVRLVLSTKDKQLDSTLQAVVDREKKIHEMQRQLQALHRKRASGASAISDSTALPDLSDSFAGPPTNSSFALGSTTQSEAATSVVAAAVSQGAEASLNEFAAMVKELRARNTELQRQLLSGDGDAADVSTLLGERDEAIAVRDRRIMEQTIMVDSLQTALARLEHQLEEAGLQPQCRLDSETRALVDERAAKQLADIEVRQRELEEDNAKKSAEKQRVASLLSSMNEDRLKDNAKFAQQQAELERIKIEARAKEQREAEAARQLQQLRQEKEREELEAKELREQLQENTRLMMEAQARLALQREEEQSSGLFSRLRKRFSN